MPHRRRALHRAAALGSAVAVSLGGLLVSSGTAYADLPLCTRHDSVGPDGTVQAQVNQAGQVVWGVTMNPSSKSAGVWKFRTFYNGKPSRSGFDQVTTGPYVPHGVTPESRPGMVWSAKGMVMAGMEYCYIVGDQCYIPK